MTEQPHELAARSWRAWLDAPSDIAWLAAFRVLFGLTLFVSMYRFIAYGWLEEFFLLPRFHFKYWGFAWVEPLDEVLLRQLHWVLAGAALLVAAGVAFRLSALVLVVGFTYLQLIDVTTYLNHYYLASLLGGLLLCAPAHRAWSVDAWLFPRLRSDVIARGWQVLFRFQVGVVYTFAGFAKAHGDWLWHATPLRIWLGAHTDLPVIGPLFRYEVVAYLMSWGGFLFDTGVPWLLLYKRTRPYAYVVLIGFHLAVGQLFPIGMFPVIMMLAATVFFDAGWPRRFLRLPASLSRPAPLGRPWVALAAVYCAVQLLMPLRCFAYGGNVRWHEQGMRFSWRVMVREKNGAITYVVHSKAKNRTWHVAPERYLTPRQVSEIEGQPDLILQLAHHIGREFERKGLGPVEVRVLAVVSLNGRSGRPMIDPEVDLNTVRDGLARASWILPAPEEAPPHTRPI